MRHALLAFLLAATFYSAEAAEIRIGETLIVIPTPIGLAMLTPDIQPLYDVSRDMLNPTNTRLITFVDEAIIPNALSGEMPAFERFVNVETMSALQGKTFTASEFMQFKTVVRTQTEESIAAMMVKMPSKMAGLSNRVSETLDLDIALSISNVVPLPIHHESARTIANSSIMKYAIASDADNSDHIVSMTMTFVFLKGKILFVYIYGGPDDLEWTRKQANEWIKQIIALNHV